MTKAGNQNRDVLCCVFVVFIKAINHSWLAAISSCSLPAPSPGAQ